MQIEPENSEALNALGYMYAEDGVHLDEAVRMVRQAIEIDPANGAYYDSLGWALYKKGMYAESLVALQKAETFIEDEILYDHIGDVYKALNKYTQACRYWRKSLDLDPHQISVQQKIKGIGKMDRLTVLSPAKLNLVLDVLGKRPDGFHELRTIFERISLADQITLSRNKSNKISIRCAHPHVPLVLKNLVFKAADDALP